MSAGAGFSGETNCGLFILEHSCHNFYCAHIFCEKFCLFFLFSCKMNKRKEKKRKNPPLPQQKPRERKRKKTQLTGPGKVIKGLKSSMWRCRHAFLRYGGLRKYSTCSMRKGRKIFTITSPPPPLSALNQQALYQ